MLRKLVKYDFNYYIKYWLIAAVTTVGLAVVCGLCFKTLAIENDKLNALKVLCLLAGVISAVAIFGLLIFTRILGVVRYYKNLFTDEGYLTFTLPAKSSELLSSKVLVNYLFTAISSFVVIFDVFIVLSLAIPKELFDASNWRGILEVFGEMFAEMKLFTPLYALQLLLFVVALPLLQIMVDYCAVTVAAALVRKYKVLVAIGIYYGVSVVTSYFSQFAAMSFASESVIKTIEKLSENQIMGMISIVFLAITTLIVLVSLILYTLSLHLVNTKLNLD